MADLKNMLESMKEEPWATWKIAADAMEEAGDKRSAGLRKLAEHKLYPAAEATRGRFFWVWKRSWKHRRKYEANVLPWRVFDHKAISFDPNNPHQINPNALLHGDSPPFYFTSPGEAVLAAAEAWSDILAEQALKKRKK